MTSKERVLATVRRQAVDRLPPGDRLLLDRQGRDLGDAAPEPPQDLPVRPDADHCVSSSRTARASAAIRFGRRAACAGTPAGPA